MHTPANVAASGQPTKSNNIQALIFMVTLQYKIKLTHAQKNHSREANIKNTMIYTTNLKFG